MASSDQIRSGIQSGLPDLPNGLPDKEYRLVAPLYQAIKNITAQISKATGLSSYPSSAYPDLAPKDTLTTGNVTKMYAQASEAIAYGDPVNFHIVGTQLSVRKADAVSNAKPCQGICTQSGGIAVGVFGQLMLGPGLVLGATTGVSQLYLAVGGGITTARPAGAGNIIQALGFSLDTGGIWFAPSALFIQL